LAVFILSRPKKNEKSYPFVENDLKCQNCIVQCQSYKTNFILKYVKLILTSFTFTVRYLNLYHRYKCNLSCSNTFICIFYSIDTRIRIFDTVFTYNPTWNFLYSYGFFHNKETFFFRNFAEETAFTPFTIKNLDGNSQNFLGKFVRFFVCLRCFYRVVIHRR